MMGNEHAPIVMFGSPSGSAHVRHAVPASIADPIIYVEVGDDRRVFAHAQEIPLLRERLSECAVHPVEDLAYDALVAEGYDFLSAQSELLYRALREAEVTNALVPEEFPLGQADYLRERGITLQVDEDVFRRRRRTKSDQELDGIRRAQSAAEAILHAIREAIASGETDTTVIRRGAKRVVADFPATLGYLTVAPGASGAQVHSPGEGDIRRGQSIIVDIVVRDDLTYCWTDMTRTYCVGEPSAELQAYHNLVLEALQLTTAELRAGVSGAYLNELACSVFEAHGYPTMLNKPDGEALDVGFVHGLGHSIGLEVHEYPELNPNGPELQARDVVTLEPGLYRPGFGGCRLEDVAIVTETGCEVVSTVGYDLVI